MKGLPGIHAHGKKGRVKMNESILKSLKQYLGIPEDVMDFDQQIISEANSAFMVLNQLGLGPDGGFEMTGYEETWFDFLRTKSALLSGTKSYVTQKVRIVFDPPVSSFVLDSLQKRVEELEWRLQIQAERIDADDGIEPHALRSSGHEMGRAKRSFRRRNKN